MTHTLNWTFLFWWVGIGTALFLIFTFLTWKDKNINRAGAWAMLGVASGLYGLLPLILLFDSANIQLILYLVAMSAIIMVPLMIFWRRQDAVVKAEKQSRADEAEEIIRRFGA